MIACLSISLAWAYIFPLIFHVRSIIGVAAHQLAYAYEQNDADDHQAEGNNVSQEGLEIVEILNHVIRVTFRPTLVR